jgi:hypothetical protein
MDDCKVTMHVEERTIHMAVGRGRDRVATLAKLRKARESRSRFHGTANDKQKALERIYGVVANLQDEMIKLKDKLDKSGSVIEDGRCG